MDDHSDSVLLEFSEWTEKIGMWLMRLGLLAMLFYIEAFLVFPYAKQRFDQVWTIGLVFVLTLLFVNAAFALMASANKTKKMAIRDFWICFGVSCGVFLAGYLLKPEPPFQERPSHERTFKQEDGQPY
jgi:hypothetical protein